MEGGADPDQEEIDAPEKVNVAETSTARSYDCMYCKRGFSTAQALGGHMNIHRRDRARVRESIAAAASPTPAEEELVQNARYAAQHKDLIKPLFPLASEPSRPPPPPHLMFQLSPSAPPPWDREWQVRDDVDPAKREELKLYGKDLELGCKNLDQNDQQDEINDNQSEKENLNLRLGL